MTISEWLKDLSENYRVEIVDGEVKLVRNDGGV